MVVYLLKFNIQLLLICNQVLLLRNHGLVALGSSIEEAFHIAHKLVKACEIQVRLKLSLKGLAKAEVLSYIVPGMQVATSLNVEVAPV